ncbi:unnamed protein product [Effrenium voratum]|nr:unnamed protein product [Effrenium voratum]
MSWQIWERLQKVVEIPGPSDLKDLNAFSTMVQKARPAELSSQVQHAELAWTFLLGFTRAQVSPSVSALLANPDWRSAYDSSRVVRERGAKLHLEPDWARLEKIVCSKGFKEAISEFSSLRQAVLRSSPIQLAGMVAQARVAWLFLVGFGEKRRLFQSQLAEVVRVLRKESGWRSSLEELRPELQSGIAALPESLQTAFGAEGENARPGGLRAAEDDLETVVRGVEAQLTAPDVDASDSKAKERVMREIKEACTRVRSGHKAEENRERSTLVEAKDEEGIYWVKLLNEARLGCAPPQSSQAWQKVIGDWSQSHEARLARAREQAKNAEALAQQAAEKCDKLKKEYEDKSRAKAGIDAKLKLQQETLQLSAEEAALRHREAEELSASGGPVKQLRDILVGGNVVWVWVEDGNRAASHPEDRRNPEIDNGILYPQDVWAEIEARWLLWQHNGLQHSFSVDVGTKLFAQETGSLYSITLHAQRPFQENARTGTRRNIFRVKLGEARTARLQAELEQQRRLTAEELVKAEEQLAAQLRASACLLLAAEWINGQALELHHSRRLLHPVPAGRAGRQGADTSGLGRHGRQALCRGGAEPGQLGVPEAGGLLPADDSGEGAAHQEDPKYAFVVSLPAPEGCRGIQAPEQRLPQRGALLPRGEAARHHQQDPDERLRCEVRRPSLVRYKLGLLASFLLPPRSTSDDCGAADARLYLTGLPSLRKHIRGPHA